MFTAPALKRYVPCNTHNPRWKSFHLENWDISLDFYSFLTTFPSFQNLTFFAFWGLASLKMRIELFTQN